MSFSVMRDFIKKNQVDVINSIFLTDGDSHSCNSYWKAPETDESGYTTNTGRFDYRDENVILRDPVSKKQIQIGDKSSNRYRRGGMTSTLVKFLREVFDINIVNFFLIPKMRRWDMMNHIDEMNRGDDSYYGDADADVLIKKFRKDKYLIAPEAKGFNEQYLILGGKNLEVVEEQLEVAEDASVAQLARAFKKFSSGKLEKRKLLSRFIDMVAA